MSIRKFKVIQSNPNQRGGFVTKIQGQVPTVFGNKQATYYVSGPQQMEKDKELDVQMDDFRVAEYSMINQQNGEEFKGYWLHAK